MDAPEDVLIMLENSTRRIINSPKVKTEYPAK
jgi:hypothetical protein